MVEEHRMLMNERDSNVDEFRDDWYCGMVDAEWEPG